MNVPIAVKQTVVWQVARSVFRTVRPLRETVFQMDKRYNLETVEVMRRRLRPGTIGVDVGAHRGAILREMFSIAPDARHIAIEPIPKLAAELCQEFPQARVIEAAVSDEPGSAMFQHIVNAPTLSGLRRVRYDEVVPVMEEIKVNVMRLDDIVAPDEVVSYIKIDTEGAELPIIRGAAKTIQRCRPVIVFETGDRTTTFYGVTPADILNTIQGLGMRLSTMRRWLNARRPLTLRAFQRAFRTDSDFYFIAY
jgi:FkbM family methyltransferase